MKKLFFSSLILILSLVCLTSCETVAVATEVPASTEVVWYDTNNNLTVVYINGIANYRYWDAVYSRYIIVLFHITVIVIFADVLLYIITMQGLFRHAIMAHGIIHQEIIIDILLV